VWDGIQIQKDVGGTNSPQERASEHEILTESKQSPTYSESRLGTALGGVAADELRKKEKDST